MTKVRLDSLVQQRIDCSPSKATGLVQTGKVRALDGTPLTKPGEQVEEDLEITIDEGPKYVSRGGLKLEAALEHFPIVIADHVVIDIGASTGGFTDCLLKNGALKVHAVDVGYGQLDWSLRQDDRVVVHERTNIRNLTAEELGDSPTRFVADCSFISLRLVLKAAAPLLAPNAEGVALIKPQFEAERNQVGEGGVIRDSAIHEAVIEKFCNEARALGFKPHDVIPSPITGPAGNKEFLAYLTRGD
ncbi:MAG: TlyA family RNA methyltransferase [Candidatus Hydrogenedentota bacterium]